MIPNDAVLEHLRATLGFQYEIGRVLGRGGMGTVYFARERALDRDVAIKVLPPVAASDEARERFSREARTAARLTHPNIVPLFTFGDTGTVLYYVMGFVDGESLEARLKREGRIDPTETQRILEELAGALVYAHEKGIVHRDIKPDNILIEHGTGRAMLTDFGIAKQVAAGGETLTQTGVIVGTPRYMSPEQAAGDRDIDGRSDVYSLGVVAYTMLAGRAPFDGAGMREILTQQMTRGATPLATLAQHAPSSLCRAIDRALRTEPRDRWSDASRFLEGLRDESNDDEPMLVRAVRGGNWLVGSALAYTAIIDFAWWEWNKGHLAAPRLIGAYVLIMPLAGLIDIWMFRRKGIAWAELRRYLSVPPKWWPFWWPQRLRRPGDVWARLPKPVRAIRLLRSIGFGLFIAGLEGTLLLVATPPAAPGSGGHGVAAAVLTLLFAGGLVSLIASAGVQLRWAKRMGLSSGEADAVASKSTMNAAFWKRPHIARLLAPMLPSGVARQAPETAAELVAAIRRAADELPESMRALASDSMSAARQLADALAEFDREIAKLAQDSDPVERKRLEDRIAALNATEAPEQSQMRELYVAQLALVRRLGVRLDEVAARRARVHELLRVLWLQLADLRGQMAHDDEDSEITGRIRSVIADAARMSAAFQDLNGATPSREGSG